MVGAWHFVAVHWLVVVCAAVALGAGAALAWRWVAPPLRRCLRIAGALATDQRLPRWLRWTIRAGLAAKLAPVDFGADEVLLGVAAVVLAVRYRHVVRAIVHETQ